MSIARAFVLAAGLGTRLRPLTDVCAKPLVPIGDRPAILHAVDALREAKIANIGVNAFHHADQVRAFAERENIACSLEEERLGTAGGIARGRSILGGGAMIVWNGDIFAPDLRIASLVAAHESGAGIATFAVETRARGEGTVGVSRDGTIARLRGVTFGDEAHGGDFTGIQVVGADLELPERGCIVGDVYMPLLRGGARIDVLSVGGFVDIGTPPGYLAANAKWLTLRKIESFVAKSAIVRNAVNIPGSVIGENAEVNASARASVVWPGARVDHAVERAIVGPSFLVTDSLTP